MLILGVLWYKSSKDNLNKTFEAYKKSLFTSSQQTLKDTVNSTIRLLTTSITQINTRTVLRLKNSTSSFIHNHLYNHNRKYAIDLVTKYQTNPKQEYPFIIDPDKPSLIIPRSISLINHPYNFPKHTQQLQELIASIKSSPNGFYFNSLNPKATLKNRFITNKCYARYVPNLNLILGFSLNDQTSELSARQEIMQYILNLNSSQDDYIFIFTHDGTIISHYNPRHIGRNLYDFVDKTGSKVVKKLINAALDNPQGGFTEYTWRRPSTNSISNKIGFTREFIPMHWIIGSGIYPDNFSDLLKSQKNTLQKELNSELRIMLYLIICTLLVSGVISSILAHLIRNNIRTFITSLRDAITNHNQLEVGHNIISELDEISFHANNIIDDLSQKEQELHDLTRNLEVKIAQRTAELQTKAAELEKSTELANTANKAKSVFLANISHEIRTPMNIILGMQQLLLDSEVNHTQQNYLQKANQAAKSLLNIIDDILDFSKIEAGKLNIENIEVNLEEIADNVLSFLSYEANKKNIEIILDYDLRIPSTLIGDPLRLRQIISNICNNSIKFSSDGSILVSIRLSYSKNDSEVLVDFEVRDNGIGIAPEKQKELFKPFNQADGSSTRQFGGTGLGLIICKQLIELQGGRISLQSIPNVGTTVDFTLPFTLPPGKHLPLPSPPRARPDSRILIIDRNYSTLNILKKYAEDLGFEADIATSLTQVSKLLKKNSTNSPTYSTILINSEVAENHGIEVYHYLKKHFPLSDTCFVYLTRETTLETIRTSQELGFNNILSKPVSPHRMLQILENNPHYEISSTFLPPTTPSERRSWLKTSILIAEDNIVNQEIIEALLHKIGCRATLADNGEIAVDLAQSNKFDIIFMDIQMPVMDGLEATRRIRLFDTTTPIIAITAHALSDDYTRSSEAGMNGHITKPVRLETLYQTLEKFLPSRISARDMNSEDVTNVLFQNSENIADHSKVWEQLSELEQLDTTEALKNTDNNRQILIKIYQNYIQLGMEIHSQLVTAYKAENMEEMLRLAHTLKGSCGTIGATRISEFARKLEETLKQDLQADITQEYTQLQKELASFTQALSSIFSQSPDKS